MCPPGQGRKLQEQLFAFGGVPRLRFEQGQRDIGHHGQDPEFQSQTDGCFRFKLSQKWNDLAPRGCLYANKIQGCPIQMRIFYSNESYKLANMLPLLLLFLEETNRQK